MTSLPHQSKQLTAAIVASGVLMLFLRPVSGADAVPHSLSISRQFVVYGNDVRLRGVVGDVAEQTKKDLLSTLQVRDTWKLPIVIDAQLAQANLPEQPPTSVSLSQTEAGLKLQVSLALGTQVDAAGVQRAILRALLLELIYRDQSRVAPGTAYTQPPEWLLEGLLAADAPDDVQRAMQPLAVLAAAHKISPLREVLEQRPELLDASSRPVYRAYWCGLVRMLTQGSGSGARLLSYIQHLPAASPDSLATLVAHFPAFAADAEATWRAGLAHLLEAGPNDLLGIAQTENALDPVLAITIKQPDGSSKSYRLHQFADFLHEPGAPLTLQHANRDLIVLGTRANPIYRPIISNYQQITALLARRKTSGIAARLTSLQSLRAQLSERTRQIDDYLNWFEATQAQTPSGLFTDYLKAAEHAGDALPERPDAISRYLRSVEAQLRK